MKNISIIVIFVLFSIPLLADGILKGKVFESDSGEELIGATVQVVENKSKGARSDINGNYQISLEPGKYSIVAKYISYADKKITDIEIVEGKVNKLDIAMEIGGKTTSVITVRADRINDNEAALLSEQKNSINVQDGISSEQIANLGASNSAESMKQVTGASLEGGKYVVMRGLGDRYSISQLNGTTLPSTDPYRNSANMDIISANMIENIVTKKTFTPDQPGNFTGGNIDITTKSLPDKFYMNAGISLGYNTVSSFNDNFITDPINGSTDFLGIDDGSRELPSYYGSEANRNELGTNLYIDARNKSKTEAGGLYERAGRDFNTPFVPEVEPSLMNFGTSVGFGDRFDFEDEQAIGYNFSFNFNRGYSVKQDWLLVTNEYLQGGNGALREFIATEGIQSSKTSSWGGILSLAYKIDEFNEISLEGMFNHDGDESAGSLSGIWPGAINVNHTYYANNIAFVERDLVSGQLKGKHAFGDDAGIKLNWVAGTTGSSQYEPDMRLFSYYSTDASGETVYIINDNELQLPFHFYRNLTDMQYTAKADLTIPVLQEQSGVNELKFGTYNTYKNRDFSELRFQLSKPNQPSGDYIDFSEADKENGFADFFDQSNFGLMDDDPNFQNRWSLGNTYLNQTQAANRYNGYELISAIYAMMTYEITEDLKTVFGVRGEYTNMNVEAGNGVEGSIEVFDPLPSVNFIYSLSDNQNLRLSGSQTVARPNLRELAPFSSVDFIGGFFFRGNDTLERTKIINADFRWELFPNPGEVIALSAFYKNFENPIVKQLNPQASGGQVYFTNVPTGNLYGLELEYRQDLVNFVDALENFNFSVNFTYTFSETELLDSELNQFRNINPNYPTSRPFIAQSPFIVNLYLGYTNPDWGTSTSLSLNTWGERLTQTGFGGAPDLYEVRGRVDGNDVSIIPDVSFNVNQQLTDNWNVTMRINNILNAPFLTYQELNNEIFTVESFEIGQTINFGLKYNF